MTEQELAFVRAVIEDERKACAAVCRRQCEINRRRDEQGRDFIGPYSAGCLDCETTILARDRAPAPFAPPLSPSVA